MRPAYYSESLARGLQVLRAFDREAPRLRIRDVAERAGLNRAAARRFLLTLCDLGYIACENDVFFLRPRVLDLGYSYLSSADIRGVIQPLLDDLAERTREATTLAVIDGAEALIIARACKRTFDLAIGSGSRLPLDRTALGLVLLAALPELELDALLERVLAGEDAAGRESLRRRLRLVARQGHASIVGLLNPQLVAAAAPIRDRGGRTIAALNVTSYTTSRSHDAVNKKFLKPLLETQSQIEAALRSSDAIPLSTDSNFMGAQGHRR
ncbi:MAG: helix-turn-helix domain-containing protein [Hyphomicrobiales bacterium]|nr:helix-turn-helix domain-containing protein [Hyphomicrobiales bacterium]